MSETTHEEKVKKLGEMIRGIRIAMLTTAMPDGTLRSRPMATQEAEFDGDLWFFTGAGSPKAHEIEEDAHVNVSYVDAEGQRYASVSGRARIVRDRQKAEELWSPAYKAWFPEGLDDPDLALLKVVVDGAEYWDSPSSAAAHLIGTAKALATGERYQPGENEKLNL